MQLSYPTEVSLLFNVISKRRKLLSHLGTKLKFPSGQKSGPFFFAIIYEELFPLPRYCEIGGQASGAASTAQAASQLVLSEE